MDLHLQDKAAIVAGGSTGLGAESARQLAAEGAKLVLAARSSDWLDRQAAALRQRYQADVATVAADHTEAGAADQVAGAGLDRFGRIDILINSTAAPQGGPLWELPDSVWESAFTLKVVGTMRMVRAVFPTMRRQRYGRIVLVGGDTGRQPSTRLLPSSAANAAVLALAKGLADEAGPHGIHVNVVSPGLTKTERITARWAEMARESGTTTATVEADFQRGSPLGTVGEPEDVARLIVFLASDAATNITGTSITTDGGRSRGLA